jgi:hypothetical protein
LADSKPEQGLPEGSDPWSDLGLTLPIFIGYHLGVVFLPMRNAADIVTRELVALANNDLLKYGGLTLLLGVVFVGVLAMLGRGHTLKLERFAWVLAEGVAYAVVMRLIAGYVVGRLPLTLGDRASGLVMSLGAGFYEEIAFRVVLFGLGAKVLRLFAEPISSGRAQIITLVWAVVAAAVFSGWHHLGEFGEPFELRAFVFRWVCGLVFTAIYAFRGFAPVVWTHALYDIWVLVL